MSSFSQTWSSTIHSTTSSAQHLHSFRVNFNTYACRVKAHLDAVSSIAHAASQYIGIRNASTCHMRVMTVAGTAGPRQSSARCGVGLPTRTREYTRANTLAIPYQCHTSTNLKFASYYLYPFSNNLNMTIISNDPSWWPIINAYRLSSNFAGSWRAVGD
ncbi:hypothetical protein BD769DRAFT_1424749 [Suillus cothurnatus]|nr:hypothetical protein BD769DRAFT_1424749 [Suillus cothurnatus]